MTLDEAIKHSEEVAEKYERHLKLYENMDDDLFRVEKNECKECAKEHGQLANWLKELKQLREQTRWIPCSERTPEKGGEYLLWGKISEYDEENYCFLGDYFEFEEEFGIEKSNYDSHTLGFLDTEIDEYYSVIAWMPLPDPYEAESEGKEWEEQ